MNEKKPTGNGFLHNVITAFAYSMIAISVIGFLLGDDVKELSSLFRLGSEGLSFPSILQIFIFSLILVCLRTLLLSDLIFKKMMLLWRCVLLLLLTLVLAGIFAALFRWFPVELWEAWVSFILSVVVCFVIGAGGMILKTKLEDKKYDKLLSDYKAKQKKESGE